MFTSPRGCAPLLLFGVSLRWSVFLHWTACGPHAQSTSSAHQTGLSSFGISTCEFVLSPSLTNVSHIGHTLVIVMAETHNSNPCVPSSPCVSSICTGTVYASLSQSLRCVPGAFLTVGWLYSSIVLRLRSSRAHRTAQLAKRRHFSSVPAVHARIRNLHLIPSEAATMSCRNCFAGGVA